MNTARIAKRMESIMQSDALTKNPRSGSIERKLVLESRQRCL